MAGAGLATTTTGGFVGNVVTVGDTLAVGDAVVNRVVEATAGVAGLFWSVWQETRTLASATLHNSTQPVLSAYINLMVSTLFSVGKDSKKFGQYPPHLMLLVGLYSTCRVKRTRSILMPSSRIQTLMARSPSLTSR